MAEAIYDTVSISAAVFRIIFRYCYIGQFAADAVARRLIHQCLRYRPRGVFSIIEIYGFCRMGQNQFARRDTDFLKYKAIFLSPSFYFLHDINYIYIDIYKSSRFSLSPYIKCDSRPGIENTRGLAEAKYSSPSSTHWSIASLLIDKVALMKDTFSADIFHFSYWYNLMTCASSYFDYFLWRRCHAFHIALRKISLRPSPWDWISLWRLFHLKYFLQLALMPCKLYFPPLNSQLLLFSFLYNFFMLEFPPERLYRPYPQQAFHFYRDFASFSAAAWGCHRKKLRLISNLCVMGNFSGRHFHATGTNIFNSSQAPRYFHD